MGKTYYVSPSGKKENLGLTPKEPTTLDEAINRIGRSKAQIKFFCGDFTVGE